MRNAAAHFDDDIGYDEPARRKAPRKPRATGGKSKARKKKNRGFGFDMHKVARYAAIGMSATLAIGIMVNALVMQKGRHPAPLFKTTITLAEKPVTPMPVRVARDITPDPVVEANATTEIASPPPPAVKPHRTTTAAATPDKGTGEDQIAKLLQGATPPASSGDKTETKTVTGAQKALAKLGFALKPNGTFGPATRKAIEQFEKERNLPVNGELSRRVVKILSAESGVKID